MANIRWNPWSFNQWLDEDLELPATLARWGLAQGINIYETEDSLVAELAFPGLSENDIDVSVEDRTVRSTGSRKINEEEKKSRNYYMNSLNTTYSYVFRLPPSVAEGQEPKAELSGGILILTFSKMQKNPPKKIKIAGSSKQNSQVK